MPGTDELLNKLKQETELTHLNESFDFSNISYKISNTISDVIDSMNLSSFALSDNERDIIYKIKRINIDPSWRILSYPNIHNDNKYKIETSIIFDYVISKIKQNAKDEKSSFNSTETIEESLSKCLKLLTGYTPGSKITLNEFKYYYQMKVFGSYSKVLIQPRLYTLTSMANRTPMIISYIDNNLVIQKIKNMNEYSKTIENDFKSMIKNNPRIEKRCNTYLSCISRAIRTELHVYEIIRGTMIQLHREYMYIFRELIRLNSINNESTNSISWLNDTMKLYSDICNLNESIDDRESLYDSFTKRFDDFISDKNSKVQNLKNAIGYAAEQSNTFTKFCRYIPGGLVNFCDINFDDIDFDSFNSSNTNDNIMKYTESITRGTNNACPIDKIIKFEDLDIFTDNSLKIIDKLNSLISRFSEARPNNNDSDDMIKSKLIKFSILTRLFDSYYSLASYFMNDILNYKLK